MSASKELKKAGVKGGVAQAARLCGKCENTIQNWYIKEPELFKVITAGCLVIIESNKNKKTV